MHIKCFLCYGQITYFIDTFEACIPTDPLRNAYPHGCKWLFLHVFDLQINPLRSCQMSASWNNSILLPCTWIFCLLYQIKYKTYNRRKTNYINKGTQKSMKTIPCPDAHSPFGHAPDSTWILWCPRPRQHCHGVYNLMSIINDLFFVRLFRKHHVFHCAC